MWADSSIKKRATSFNKSGAESAKSCVSATASRKLKWRCAKRGGGVIEGADRLSTHAPDDVKPCTYSSNSSRRSVIASALLDGRLFTPTGGLLRFRTTDIKRPFSSAKAIKTAGVFEAKSVGHTCSYQALVCNLLLDIKRYAQPKPMPAGVHGQGVAYKPHHC